MALSERQEEAAALVASDHLTHQQIARTVGISRKTLYEWLKRPAVAARVERLRTDFAAAVRRKGIALKERRLERLNDAYDRLTRVMEARAEAYKDAPLGGDTGLVVRQVKLVKVYDAGELILSGSHDELDRQPHGGALKRRRRDPLPDISIRDLLESGTLPGADDGVTFEVEDRKDGVLISVKRSVEVVEWPIDTALLREMREHLKAAAIEKGEWNEDGDGDSLGTGPGQLTITAIRYHEPGPATAHAS